MSRSGYTDDYPESREEAWSSICWRGAVVSALRGKRGQAFLREMLAALDALPVQRLIAGDLEYEGEVCAIGSVGRARGMDMSDIEAEDREMIAARFGIAEAMVGEIEYQNDEAALFGETAEQRFVRVRAWIVEKISP